MKTGKYPVGESPAIDVDLTGEWKADGEADGTQVRALELLGKSMGLWIDKVETEDKTERNEQQLEKDIEQKLIALGIK